MNAALEKSADRKREEATRKEAEAKRRSKDLKDQVAGKCVTGAAAGKTSTDLVVPKKSSFGGKGGNSNAFSNLTSHSWPSSSMTLGEMSIVGFGGADPDDITYQFEILLTRKWGHYWFAFVILALQV